MVAGICVPPSGVIRTVTEQVVPSVVDVTTMSVGPTGSTVLTGVKRNATAAPMVALPGRSVGPSTLAPEARFGRG